jgi:glycosyltransferase involved in cell wall biosynthesis
MHSAAAPHDDEQQPVRREVWLASPLPPPTHGVSTFNTLLLEALRTHGIPNRAFRVGTRGALSGIEKIQLRKVVQDGLALVALAEAGLRAPRTRARPTLYFTPSQGLHGKGSATVVRDLAIARLGRALGLRVVAHLHGCGWLHREPSLITHGMFEVLRACDTLICMGEAYARSMSAATRVPCVGINNGVAPQPDVGPRRALARGERVELLFLSNLMGEKGLFVAGEAVRELARRGVRARLRCAGAWLRGEEEASFLEIHARELASGEIELVGFADAPHKERLFRTSHFYLLPSLARDEGQPLALIEALAHGLVPITTPQGGIPDLLGADLTSTCSTAHQQAAGVAETIVSFLRAPEAYAQASERCLARQRSALTTEACMRAVIDVLQGLNP